MDKWLSIIFLILWLYYELGMPQNIVLPVLTVLTVLIVLSLIEYVHYIFYSFS